MVLAAAAIAVGYGPLVWIPLAWRHPARAFGVVLLGAAASFVTERYLFRWSWRQVDERHRGTLRFLVRLFLYVAVFLGVLGALGVGFSSVLFGGAFLTVIIGLAGQTMFGNLIAGIGLILFRPFVVGERIVFVAWQYPVLMPSFPHEALRPGYTGTVTDINLMYTALRDDAGLEIFVPNGVIIQAMIENHTRSGERLVRLRFEVSLDLPWEQVAQTAAAVARRLPYPVQWLPADVGPTSYGVLFLVRAPAGRAADHIRAELLELWIPALQAVRVEAAEPASWERPTRS